MSRARGVQAAGVVDASRSPRSVVGALAVGVIGVAYLSYRWVTDGGVSCIQAW